MVMHSSQVIEKFTKYGFEYKKKQSNNSFLTFTFKSGFFHNAEVVQIAENDSDSKDIQKKISGLKELGVSIKINKYKSMLEIEEGLFNGFFDVVDWKLRIAHEYEEYAEKVLQALPGKNKKYSYINAPYSIHGANDQDEDKDNIVDDVIKTLDETGAQLILIEAPAGFGKTCTSYEIINELVKNDNSPTPFFTEFSRDRQARVFGHVFVREVDRAFNQVKSNVVIDELQNGRIVMVLDGFDELLNGKNSPDIEDDYEDAEPMLETIGELLDQNAKIVITSRRSAIFDGVVFNEWIDKYIDKFKFKRYRISAPCIDNWLDRTRQERVQSAGIDINKLSNPVLLSYLRALTSEDFNLLCDTPEQIVSTYFDSMLEREQERQNLPMSPEKQTELLSNVAQHMCEENYTSDSKEKIIEIFKSRCMPLLESTRKNYSAKDRPTIDSLSNTLATHAFFDRSNQGEGRIEFINEFVFGNYIAEAINDFEGDWIASDERFIEPVIVSYSPRNQKEKISLWDKLQPMSEFLSASDRMRFELEMLGNVVKNTYDHSSINSIELSDIKKTPLFDGIKLNETSFSNCKFFNCIFAIDNISNITFINCKFYDCENDGNFTTAENIMFLNCESNNGFMFEIEEFNLDDDSDENQVSIITRNILEKYLPVGSNGMDRIHIPLASIYKMHIPNTTKKDFVKEIKRLKNIGFLEDAKSRDYIAMNINKIAEIKKLLGRA